MAKLEQLIQEIRGSLGADFISTDVVGMDGISIAGGSASPDFDSNAASARFAMVMKLGSKISGQLTWGDVDDVLVTTDRAYILSRFLGNGSYFWELTVTRNATLGSVRVLMNEYIESLWDAIPGK